MACASFPIVIGAFEARAIAVAIENWAINRPLSRDLIKNILDAFSIQLKEVLIDNLLGMASFTPN